MRIIVLFIFAAISLQAVSQKPFVSKVWVADMGDGTYKNPVLHADYSDPDAIRVGDDYYMTSSSFEDVPGLPILPFERPGELAAYWPCLTPAVAVTTFFAGAPWRRGVGTCPTVSQRGILPLLSRS
jgi:hypothetical protein